MEKNMLASKGHRIIAVGNEAYDMFEKAPANIVVEKAGINADIEQLDIACIGAML